MKDMRGFGISSTAASESGTGRIFPINARWDSQFQADIAHGIFVFGRRRTRDFLQGSGLSSVNFALDTNVSFLGEQGSIEFRAEAFNIFNHPNFAAPRTSIFSGSTTAVTETAAATATAGSI